LEKYISSRGDEYDLYSSDVADTVAVANSLEAKNVELLSELNLLMISSVPALIAIVVIVGVKLSRGIIVPIRSLIRATGELARGNYEAELGDIGKDETELLSSRFDEMRRELKERDRNKDEFIKIAAHELRTPIQPIISYVELARKNIVDKDKALAEIDVQAKRLVRLSSDLLDVAKSDTGVLS
jgi:signal transduction histidine kinase